MIALAAPPQLAADETHVWILSTDISSERCGEFRKLLSPDERGRADRFVFESDRVRFTASHGMLRTRLGAYCGTPPESLVFGIGAHGKPMLMNPSTPIQFNLSHSGSRAAISVTRNMRCGVDIEKLSNETNVGAVADRFFSARENEWLHSLPAPQRLLGFYRLWTVKEAIIKAIGKGLSIPLGDVDTLGVLQGTSSNIAFPDGCRVLSLWVGELNVTDGYSSALAIEATAESVPNVHILRESG